jgi:hypothetical protein
MEAERIVKGLVDRYNKGEIKCLPDRLSYNLILDSWAKSDFDQCGTRAEMILDALEQRKEDPNFYPDRRSYVSAMSAVVRSKEDNIAERVEAIYERASSRGVEDCPYMISTVLDAYATAKPNFAVKRVEELLEKINEIEVDQEGITVVFNIALKVFKEAQTKEGFLHAEKLFEKMRAEGHADTVTYSTIVTMYANQGDKSIEGRIENLLQEMNEAGIGCTTHCLNAFITLWTRYGKQAKAEEILRQMEQAYFDGRHEIAPNVVSYTALMSGWLRSRDSKKTQKVRQIFERMQSMYEDGNKEAQPNIFSYVTLLDSIVKSDQCTSKDAEYADFLVRRIYNEYKKGISPTKPNAHLVATAMNCWTKSWDRDSGERAESLLNWLIEIYEKEDDKSLQPSQHAFSTGKHSNILSRESHMTMN